MASRSRHPSSGNDDDDDWGIWPGEAEWQPPLQTPGVPDVDHTEPEVAGELEFPDGTILTVYYDRPRFGFGRWLDDQPG
jgi:hypothetical protein